MDESNIQDTITTLYLDQSIHFTGDYAFEILCIIMSTTIKPKVKIYLLDKLYNIQLVNKEKEMLVNMCNFSIGFLQEGERIGIGKGENIGLCKSIIKFMKKTSCSISEALDFFDIPKEDSVKYIDIINQLSIRKG